MNIGWQTGAGPNGERSYLSTQLVVPARYNFNQGYIYRLKLSNIPGRQGVSLYPTIEVAPTTPATDAYLAHNAIPVQFTAEDFDQVDRRRQLRDQGHLPARSEVPGTGRLGRGDAGFDPAGAGR